MAFFVARIVLYRFAVGRTTFMRNADLLVEPATKINQLTTLAAEGGRAGFIQAKLASTRAADEG